MADFDPLTVPAVMPMSVRRMNEGGFPKQALLDYEQALQQWMKSNVTNTNTRLNLVSEEVDGAYAAITTEATTRATADSALATNITTVQTNVNTVAASVVTEASARSSADTALATNITTVDAKANAATASGQIYFAAMAGPAGSVAAYGIFLTAGNVFTGLMLVAESGGTSKIVMTSGSMEFWDSSSGNLINMMSYSGGEWVLNGDVTLQATDGSGATFKWAGGHVAIRDGSGNPVVMLGLNI